MSDMRNAALLSVLLLLSLGFVVPFVEDLDDSFMERKDSDEIWLIKFYAPRCAFCKQLDPVWRQIGSELRSVGSPVRVARCDASASPAMAKEFQVLSYPLIVMSKKKVNYKFGGQRSKDRILEFAHRVSGPLVRSLSTPRLFQHAMSRHDVMIVYVGVKSELKGNFTSVAEQLIVHTDFFSTTRDVLPQGVSLPHLPAVLVLKDGTFLTFSEERDGDLKTWINRERFPNFFHIDSFTLYAMGDSEKLVLLALVEKTPSDESERNKKLLEKVAAENRELYSRSFSFGFMEETEFISGLLMSEVIVPSFIVVNLSNDGYFLPSGALETERHLLEFMDGVLGGSVECQGGNSLVQRVRRAVFNLKTILVPIFVEAPLFGGLLLAFPLSIGAFFGYLCCTAQSSQKDDDDDDAAILEPSLEKRRKYLNDKKSD